MVVNSEIIPMPEADAPLAPIIEWYNAAREIANAPNELLEAHFLQISLPRLRNIKDVSRFSDDEITLLDKFSINLSIAARISQIPERAEILMTDEFLSKLSVSDERLQILWLVRKGDYKDDHDIMEVFINEGYCSKVYQLRLAKFGRGKRSFEGKLQGILRYVARNKKASGPQINTIFQAIIQAHDREEFDWTSRRLRSACPKSVDLIEKYVKTRL